MAEHPMPFVLSVMTLSGERVEVSLPVDSPDARAPIDARGPEPAASELLRWLATRTGAFGHLVGQVTSAVDLFAAFDRPGGPYLAVVTQGHELLTRDVSSHSEGVKT